MSKLLSKLPYRDNVSCVVFRGNLFLLVQPTGLPEGLWKFPQGGVGEGETEEQAVKRELNEELGTSNFKIIGKSPFVNQYDWSDDSIRLARYRWRGQIQRYFLVEFLGTDADIKISSKEVREYRWVHKKELFPLLDKGSSHKNFKGYRKSIEKVLREFNKL